MQAHEQSKELPTVRTRPRPVLHQVAKSKGRCRDRTGVIDVGQIFYIEAAGTLLITRLLV